MNSLLEFLAFFVFLSVFVFTIFNSFLLKRKNTQLKIDLINRIKDIQGLKNVLDQQTKNPIEKTDGFLKFVSDSRDWAYIYIEETQEKVNSFINDVGPTIKYLEDYAPPILIDEQRLSLIKGYEIIKTILPESYGKIDK